MCRVSRVLWLVCRGVDRSNELVAAVSSKAMAKKDEIADLVAKLNEGRFRTFDDLARLVQHGRALSLSL